MHAHESCFTASGAPSSRSTTLRTYPKHGVLIHGDILTGLWGATSSYSSSARSQQSHVHLLCCSSRTVEGVCAIRCGGSGVRANCTRVSLLHAETNGKSEFVLTRVSSACRCEASELYKGPLILAVLYRVNKTVTSSTHSSHLTQHSHNAPSSLSPPPPVLLSVTRLGLATSSAGSPVPTLLVSRRRLSPLHVPR
ncbi:hypothetical protein BV20DRAFT_831430 [Pilatotrama ljubarskyi]|nr:hypothetical protein BV20DRAFT_831430 [Pilatotrama ljubarskyi]